MLQIFHANELICIYHNQTCVLSWPPITWPYSLDQFSRLCHVYAPSTLLSHPLPRSSRHCLNPWSFFMTLPTIFVDHLILVPFLAFLRIPQSRKNPWTASWMLNKRQGWNSVCKLCYRRSITAYYSLGQCFYMHNLSIMIYCQLPWLCLY